MSEKKDKLYKEFLEAPLKVGMQGYVIAENLVNGSFYRNDKNIDCTISEILDEDKIKVSYKEYEIDRNFKTCVIDKIFFIKNDFYIGANPFIEKPWERRIRRHDYSLEGILLECGYDGSYKKELFIEQFGVTVPEINFNPYVLDKDGNKKYYQRDFVWTLEEKRLFIDSIYNGLNCGSITLRRRS